MPVLNKWIGRIWVIAVVALVFNAVVASYNVNDLIDQDKLIQQTRSIQLELTLLMSRMKDAETGQRGFVITGDEKYLEPYSEAIEMVRTHLDRLFLLSSSNDVRQLLLVEIRSTSQAKLDELRRVTEVRRVGGFVSAKAEVDKDIGSKMMDDLRSLVFRFDRIEEDILLGRMSTARAKYRTTILTNLVGTGLAITIVLFAFRIVRRALHKRELAERAALEREDYFRTLTETIPQFVWTCDASGECVYLSRQWVEYTGIPMEQQLGYAWTMRIHPEERESVALAWNAAALGGIEFHKEYRIAGAAGGYRWFVTRGVPIRDSTGKIARWIGTNTDIQQQKEAAENLEMLVESRTAQLHTANRLLTEQQEFLDAILETVDNGIVACNAEGRLTLFNAASRAMHGMIVSDSLPDTWAARYNLFQTDGRTPMHTEQVPLYRAWKGEIVRNAEMVIRTDEQEGRFVLSNGQALRDRAGNLLGAVVSMRDITQRRKYELQLIESAQKLQESNEELEKFAYIASHDMQEPLRKIQAFGDRFLRKYAKDLEPGGTDYISRMLTSAERMRCLINDLLSFSRVSSRTQPPLPIALNPIVGDVLSDLELQIAQSDAQIVVQTLPELKGDGTLFRQLFQNLIVNALKFRRTDVTCRIDIFARPWSEIDTDEDLPVPKGLGWRIVVGDNGIGFEQQYAERIFELFQRLHGRSEYEGTGFGLAICRKIVRRAGGNIVARSEPGMGASFIIDWPTPPE